MYLIARGQDKPSGVKGIRHSRGEELPFPQRRDHSNRRAGMDMVTEVGDSLIASSRASAEQGCCMLQSVACGMMAVVVN